jgi:hypothetical protein
MKWGRRETTVGEDGTSVGRGGGVMIDGVIKDDTATVDGVTLKGNSVVKKHAVGVANKGNSVAMSSGDSPVAEGVPGEVGPLGDANGISEDGTRRVVGVSEDTDDVSGCWQLSIKALRQMAPLRGHAWDWCWKASSVSGEIGALGPILESRGAREIPRKGKVKQRMKGLTVTYAHGVRAPPRL